VQRFITDIRYQAQSWDKSRRVVAKVEWHAGELYPRVGFVATNDGAPGWSSTSTISAARQSNGSRKARAPSVWTRLSCRSFAANAVRLQLHALAQYQIVANNFTINASSRNLTRPKTPSGDQHHRLKD
jgi:hypothetical protein